MLLMQVVIQFSFKGNLVQFHHFCFISADDSGIRGVSSSWLDYVIPNF